MKWQGIYLNLDSWWIWWLQAVLYNMLAHTSNNFFEEACKMSQVHTLIFEVFWSHPSARRMVANGQFQSGCLKGIWLGVQKGSLAKWLAILFLPSMILKSRNRLNLIHELMIKWLTLTDAWIPSWGGGKSLTKSRRNAESQGLIWYLLLVVLPQLQAIWTQSVFHLGPL